MTFEMALKILIDMIKLRSVMVETSALTLPDAYFYPSININGLKTIRELATFRFTCRKCEDAPCIAVCPADALEKDEDGVVTRYTNLCVSCKSCVTICPFGTMMTDFFKHHRDKNLLFNLNDEDDMERFIKACPVPYRKKSNVCVYGWLSWQDLGSFGNYLKLSI